MDGGTILAGGGGGHSLVADRGVQSRKEEVLKRVVICIHLNYRSRRATKRGKACQKKGN